MSGVVGGLDQEEEEDTAGLLGGEPNNKSVRFGQAATIRIPKSSHYPGFLKTILLCLCLFGVGLSTYVTRSSPVYPTGSESVAPQSPMSVAPSVAAHGLGYILGFIVGGFILDKLNPQFLLFISLVTVATVVGGVPFINTVWLIDTSFGTLGMFSAFLVLGTNMACLDFWGKNSGPYIQALHLSLSLGYLSGPLLLDPIVGAVVQSGVNITIPAAMFPFGANSTLVGKRSVRSRREVANFDPVLVRLFSETGPPPAPPASSSQAAGPPTTQKTRKPKPLYTDGQKLDNSRDWEKVRIPRPDPKLIEPKARPTKVRINQDSIADILSEKVDEAGGQARLPRSVSLFNGMRSRLPLPPSNPWNVAKYDLPPMGRREQWPNGLSVPNYYSNKDYDNYDMYHQMSEQEAPDVIGNRQPPKDVENAIDVINNYLEDKRPAAAGYDRFSPDSAGTDGAQPRARPAGPQGSRTTSAATTLSPSTRGMPATPPRSSAATAATTSRTTTSTATRKSSPSPRQPALNTEAPRYNTYPIPSTQDQRPTSQRPHSHKPTKTVDRDREQLPILQVMRKFGVNREGAAYIGASPVIFFTAMISLCCLCCNPREPRARHEDAMLARKENKIFKSSMLSVMFLFGILHSGMLIAVCQVFPRLNAIQPRPDNFVKMTAGSIAACRLFFTVTSPRISPLLILVTCILISLASSVTLLLGQSAWVCIVVHAIGLASLLPTSIIYCESYMHISNKVMGLLFTGIAIGEFTVPHMFTVLTIEAEAWLGYVMLGSSFLCLILTACLWLMTRKQGNKYDRPEAQGYKLTATDENVFRELMEDEDDFEMAPPSEAVEDLQLGEDAHA